MADIPNMTPQMGTPISQAKNENPVDVTFCPAESLKEPSYRPESQIEPSLEILPPQQPLFANSFGNRPVPSFLKQQPLKDMEPSFIEEFKNCKSEYIMPQKEDSEEISSEGEFADARNLQLMDEDDTRVYLIQKQNEYNNMGFFGDMPPSLK